MRARTLCLLYLTTVLILPSCRPDDGTPHSPGWRFSNTTLEKDASLVLNLIMSGAHESDIDALVSRLLSQMNISRSELPHPWVCDPDNEVEVAELNFERALKIAQQQYSKVCPPTAPAVPPTHPSHTGAAVMNLQATK